VTPSARPDVLRDVRRVELRRRRLDRELSTARHRIPGVHGEVHQDLRDLIDVDEDAGQLAARHANELDILTDHAPQHAIGLRNDFVEVHERGAQQLATAECQQLFCQPRCVEAGEPDLLELHAHRI
jgi:hypothetical protein